MIEKSSDLETRDNIRSVLAGQERLADSVLELKRELAKPDKKLVYGIQGLADFLHCSRATAQRIKISGMLDPAISQSNRIIIIDSDLALELLRRSDNPWGPKRKKS